MDDLLITEFLENILFYIFEYFFEFREYLAYKTYYEHILNI